jgi:WD40 repeat protein
VRVWAWTIPEHTLKFECAALGGEVEDLAWDSESKRILATGGGQTKAKVFAWDTGSNLAEIVPHTKKVITGDIKSTRPFRVAFGGEDFNVSFYSGGPPFKYTHGLKEHSNFVNCLRYAPDGSRFVSVSSDKTGVVYDGEAGTVVGKLDPAGMHAGSVYSCSWSPDSKLLATSGADKTVKLWDMGGAGPTFK